jgi:hypothetical protein
MKPMAFLNESWRSEEERRVQANVSTSTSRSVPLAARWRRKRACRAVNTIIEYADGLDAVFRRRTSW